MIQKTWKTIGFAPKKDNNRIYERFRTACDRFFEAKRQFYAGMKTEMEHNLQLKIEICEAAESLMNSEEWKKATDELIALQARWKQIGAVSRRHSDAVWKRFRAACDKFFERKASHFASVDGEHEENLQKKLALLAEMAGADVKAGGYEVIREFQRRWGEIGFVPIKQKDAIQKKYKAAVDELFNTLRGSERDRSMGRFREKVSSSRRRRTAAVALGRRRHYNEVRQRDDEEYVRSVRRRNETNVRYRFVSVPNGTKRNRPDGSVRWVPDVGVGRRSRRRRPPDGDGYAVRT